MASRLTLDDLEGRLEALNEAYADAQWRMHFGRASTNELGQLEAARSSLLLDRRAQETLRRWEGDDLDPSPARRALLLSRRLRWAEIESQPAVYRLRNRIDRAIVDFRPIIKGRPVSRVERSEILRRHPDRHLRREAWMAMAPLARQIETDVRSLLRERQRLARELGWQGFVPWALNTNGLSQEWVETFLAELGQVIEAPYQAWLDQAEGYLSPDDGLRPWDLAFVANQPLALPETALPRDGLLPTVRALAGRLGLGEAARGVRVDVAEMPYAALCYAVRPPDDVRIVLSPSDGHVHYDTLFHEFGHALHWRSVQPESLAFRWESPPFNEAMACLWERLVAECDWLDACQGVGPALTDGYRDMWARRTVLRLRMLTAQTAFEYLAYTAVDDDLAELFRDVFAGHLKVPYDLSPGWADGPFWTSHPVYLQNYVIGEAMASQSLAALRRQFGRLQDNPQVGAWLSAHYYAQGALIPWTEKLIRATGAPLSSADLVSDLRCNGRAIS